jgi:hypothetical protein
MRLGKIAYGGKSDQIKEDEMDGNEVHVGEMGNAYKSIVGNY